MLCRGFTTVRDAGGADWGLAQALEEGAVLGPRLLFTGGLAGAGACWWRGSWAQELGGAGGLWCRGTLQPLLLRLLAGPGGRQAGEAGGPPDGPPHPAAAGHALSQTGGHGDFRGRGEDLCACGAALRGIGRVCDGEAEASRPLPAVCASALAAGAANRRQPRRR